MCAGLALTEVQVEYQVPITALFLLSLLIFFFFSQVLQKLFAFGFDNANQELYQTIAVSL